MGKWFYLTVRVAVVWLLSVASLGATSSALEASAATEMHQYYAFTGSGAGTGSGLYDLAINKSVITAGPYTQGMDIEYLITVTNEGQIDSWDPEITDYIPFGMSLSANDDNNWTVIGGGNALNTLPTVQSGTSVSMSIILTINLDFAGGCITNQAAITDYYDDYEDCDSDPHLGFNDDEDGDGDPIDDDEDIATICVGNIILALSDISLDGKRKGSDNELTWRVTNQDALEYYEIYRLCPSQSQELVTTLSSTQEEWYNYVDRDIDESAYYRIVGIDFSGSATESSMIYIEAQEAPINLTLYPNPTADYITIEGNKIESIQVYTPQGQKVDTIDGNESETYTYNFDGAVSGMYNVVVMYSNGKTITRKVAVIN